MKTTLEIDARLAQKLQEVADRRGAIASAPAVSDCPELPELPVWKGSVELVDIANREELYRVMDEYDGFRY